MEVNTAGFNELAEISQPTSMALPACTQPPRSLVAHMSHTFLPSAAVDRINTPGMACPVDHQAPAVSRSMAATCLVPKLAGTVVHRRTG